MTSLRTRSNRVASNELRSLRPVAGDLDLEADRLQDDLELLGLGEAVLDDEHAGRPSLVHIPTISPEGFR